MVKIIKNGRVIDPESRFDGRADLWIENGKIQKIVKKDTKAESDGASDAPSIPADAEVLDARRADRRAGTGGRPRAFPRSGSDLQGGHRDGRGGCEGGRLYDGGLYGKHETGCRYAGDCPVYSGKGRENGNPCGNLRGVSKGFREKN